jgi:tRNA pseudouridine38-40 synthase
VELSNLHEPEGVGGERVSVALVVAYHGAAFHGFARQPGLATVQGSLEDALSIALRRPVLTVGAGRTDAGVHAWGQVVTFSAFRDEIDGHRLRRSVQALVGESLVVRELRLARQGFSARFDARSREYRYRIVNGPTPNLFTAQFAWHVVKPLDRDRMDTAALALLGEHDFASFCVTQSAKRQSTVRTVDTIELLEEEHLNERCLVVRVVGRSFLHSMVRTIVGTLVDVGVGRQEPEWVAQALVSRSRAIAGPTAPACGLTFQSVHYDEDVWLGPRWG